MSALSICVLASGSTGNCIHLATPTTHVLVDAGLSARETAARMARLKATPDMLQGICLTHEHSDHTAGLKPIHNRHKTPLFANAGTVEAIRIDPELRSLQWRIFENASPFEIGDIRFEPFSIPHDAADPVGYVVETNGARMAIALDLGAPTALVRRRLRDCRALILESNHDTGMLGNSNRPWPLKQRILGRHGHLSNRAAAELLAEIAGPTLEHVFLGHLSSECNSPDLALSAAKQALARAGFPNIKIHPTFPEQISEIVAL